MDDAVLFLNGFHSLKIFFVFGCLIKCVLIMATWFIISTIIKLTFTCKLRFIKQI